MHFTRRVTLPFVLLDSSTIIGCTLCREVKAQQDTKNSQTMFLPWTKKQSTTATTNASDGLDRGVTAIPTTNSNTGSNSFSQLFGGKGKRSRNEVQVIPNPCLPPAPEPQPSTAFFSTLASPLASMSNQPNSFDGNVTPTQEFVNDWEVEIVPVPPKPALRSRTMSFSKLRSSRKVSSSSSSPSQIEEPAAMENEHNNCAPEMPNHFYNCVVIADGVLKAASDTVLDMIVKTITVADGACNFNGSTQTQTSVKA